MTREEFESVQNTIDYQFNNLNLLQQAFVRSSYSAEYGGGDNEVLEFIGDKVLDLYVVKHLVQMYGGFCHDSDEFDDDELDEFISEYSEGELTKMKTQLVQRKMLAHRIDLLGFSKYLILGKGDVKNKVYKQDSVKEDLFEAIVGAVALDSGWNMEVLEHVLNNMLEPDAELENDDDCENYIALIQEWALDYDGELPRYHVERYPSGGFYSTNIINPQYIQANGNVMTYGRDNFRCLLYLNGLDKPVMAYGHSEKEARMNAAETAYNYIEENDLLYSIRDEIENPNREESINQLETLARRGYFSIPTYDFDQNYDNDGNPIWKCDCHIVEYKKVTHGKASAKKEAKKTAAYKMLKFVLENE